MNAPRPHATGGVCKLCRKRHLEALDFDGEGYVTVQTKSGSPAVPRAKMSVRIFKGFDAGDHKSGIGMQPAFVCQVCDRPDGDQRGAPPDWVFAT